jgi:DNA-binding transcriptional LysR family regulator
MQVRQLEAQLGVPLFHRTTRRVELTAEGAQLLTHAHRAVAEWETGLQKIREAADMQRGTLAVACVPTLAATRLPAALAAYQQACPGIKVTLRELATRELVDSLRRQEVDLAIGPGADRATDLDFFPVATDPIVALAASAYPLGRRDRVDLATLCAYPILLNSWSAELRAALERALALRGLAFDVKFEVLHVHTLVAFALAGLGVAVLPGIALPPTLPAAMQVLPVGDPAMTRTVGILTRRGHSLSPAGEALKDVVMHTFPRA